MVGAVWWVVSLLIKPDWKKPISGFFKLRNILGTPIEIAQNVKLKVDSIDSLNLTPSFNKGGLGWIWIGDITSILKAVFLFGKILTDLL